MKLGFLALTILFSNLSFADSLTNTHWNLIRITCADGSSSKIPSDVRYNVHFLANSVVETAVLRPSDWVVDRGTYSLDEVNQKLCLRSDEIISSGEPTRKGAGEFCVKIEDDNELMRFTWVVDDPVGGDCPWKVPVTATFEKM